MSRGLRFPGLSSYLVLKNVAAETSTANLHCYHQSKDEPKKRGCGALSSDASSESSSPWVGLQWLCEHSGRVLLPTSEAFSTTASSSFNVCPAQSSRGFQRVGPLAAQCGCFGRIIGDDCVGLSVFRQRTAYCFGPHER